MSAAPNNTGKNYRRVTTSDLVKITLWVTANKEWIESKDGHPDVAQVCRRIQEDTGLDTPVTTLRTVFKSLGVKLARDPVADAARSRFIAGNTAIRITNDRISLLWEVLNGHKTVNDVRYEFLSATEQITEMLKPKSDE